MSLISSSWIQRCRDGWIKWQAELLQLLPQKVRARLQQSAMLPAVTLKDHEVLLWMPTVHQGIVTRGLHASSALPSSPESSFAQAAFPNLDSPVMLWLDGVKVLRRQLTLPAALSENLAQTFAYETDRYTPFHADEVYSDIRLLSHHEATEEIEVAFAVIPKKPTDTLLARARSLGFAVGGILADAPDRVEEAFNLLPESKRDHHKNALTQRIKPMMIAVILALIAVTALPLIQKADYLSRLTQSVQALRGKALRIETLYATQNTYVAQWNVIQKEKTAFPTMLSVLNEVTQLLPTDTWLTQLEVRLVKNEGQPQRYVYLRGESKDASKLIPLLDESTLFHKTAPRASITGIQNADAELFDIGTQMIALPLKEEEVLEIKPVKDQALPSAIQDPASSHAPLSPTPNVQELPEATATPLSMDADSVAT
ncbi:MAG: PilN domain-containing protein, partial [Burkholderiales bacterium]|nr:PilN domain-containing protein [Burkholderiales bacterium]